MRKTFKAVLKRKDESLPWNVVAIPFDPQKLWPGPTARRVKGSIKAAGAKDAFAFCTSLFGNTERGYFMLVTRKLQKGACLQLGSLAEITLEPDSEGTGATPPPQLAKLLKQDREVRKWFESLNYSLRKYIADQIQEPKSAEARTRRAEQWMERLLLTMEGEQVLPPILQLAFNRRPQARAAWESTTLNQRRLRLLGIFSAQSPEARAKRIDRIFEEILGNKRPTRTLEDDEVW